MLVTGLRDDAVANNYDDKDDNKIVIVYDARFSPKHSLQAFHRVIYCIITELNDMYEQRRKHAT